MKKIKNFVIRNPYWSTLFFPFVGTIFFLFLFAYIKVLNLNSAIIILLGWIGWIIYCIVAVGKGNRVRLTVVSFLMWFGVIIALLFLSTILFQGVPVSARSEATRSDYRQMATFLGVEMANCIMGDTTTMNGNLTCVGRTADSVIAAAVIAKDDVMNAYELDKSAVTSGGTNTSDSDVGYIRLSVSGENIIIKTCYTKPCATTANRRSKTIALQ
jgi:hypothetical protein